MRRLRFFHMGFLRGDLKIFYCTWWWVGVHILIEPFASKPELWQCGKAVSHAQVCHLKKNCVQLLCQCTIYFGLCVFSNSDVINVSNHGAIWSKLRLYFPFSVDFLGVSGRSGGRLLVLVWSGIAFGAGDAGRTFAAWAFSTCSHKTTRWSWFILGGFGHGLVIWRWIWYSSWCEDFSVSGSSVRGLSPGLLPEPRAPPVLDGILWSKHFGSIVFILNQLSLQGNSSRWKSFENQSVWSPQIIQTILIEKYCHFLICFGVHWISHERLHVQRTMFPWWANSCECWKCITPCCQLIGFKIFV